MNCRLCDSFECKNLPVNDSRHFYLCENCGLIFVAVSGHLTFDEEKSRYDLHSNDSTNAGYVAFLNEVVSAIEKKCSAPARLLDYGCGKNKVLAGLLNQRGFVCDAYDPLYGIGSDVFSQKYDAIILCEVIEHVRNLSETTGRIRRSLGRGGIVVVRTRLYPSVQGFGKWWYKNDSTHINFFSLSAMEFLADELKLKLVAVESSDVFIFA